jgi:hypothetical protein
MMTLSAIDADPIGGFEMKIEDEVLEILRHLPDEKKADVLRFAERVEAKVERDQLPRAVSDQAAAALAWIDDHRTEYVGQWVAMEGDHLVAHGVDARLVAERARSLGVRVPFMHHVDEKKAGAVWGAWL